MDPELTGAPDEALVSKVLGGDRGAFGVLVERYQDRMLAYVRYMGFDESESRDVVQDAFVRAFRHLPRCGDPQRFGGWLFKIVSNLCRTAGTRARRRSTEPLDAHGSSLVSPAALPDEEVESGWLKSEVRRALDRVAPDQREALVLMYLQSYSVVEIAELTGASVSAVKMRLKRGREALGALLGPLLTEVPDR